MIRLGVRSQSKGKRENVHTSVLESDREVHARASHGGDDGVIIVVPVEGGRTRAERESP